jgi:hypothetical protein
MHYSPIQPHHQQQQQQQQHQQPSHQQQHHPHHLQQPNVKSMPPPYPVNNNNYSPHLPMMDPHHYEQQLHQYANNEMLAASPVLPPHLGFRQQQRNEAYMPQVQATALPPGAPRPMMPPHLPPHLQYQQRFPLQDMMPPIPPHMMTNGKC